MPSFWVLEDDWTGLICVAKKKENILQFMMTNNMLRDAELDPDTRSYAFREWEDEEIERFVKLILNKEEITDDDIEKITESLDITVEQYVQIKLKKRDVTDKDILDVISKEVDILYPTYTVRRTSAPNVKKFVERKLDEYVYGEDNEGNFYYHLPNLLYSYKITEG